MPEEKDPFADLHHLVTEITNPEPLEVEKRQNERAHICAAIAETLEKALKSSHSGDEPELEDPNNDFSDLVVRMDFKNDLSTEVRVPYFGRLQISNEKIYSLFIEYRKKFIAFLSEYIGNSEDIANIIRERIEIS